MIGMSNRSPKKFLAMTATALAMFGLIPAAASAAPATTKTSYSTSTLVTLQSSPSLTTAVQSTSVSGRILWLY